MNYCPECCGDPNDGPGYHGFECGRRLVSRHECPAPNCSKSVDDEQLACHTHWFQLSIKLRTSINNEYRNHGKTGRLQMLHAQAFEHWTESLKMKP